MWMVRRLTCKSSAREVHSARWQSTVARTRSSLVTFVEDVPRAPGSCSPVRRVVGGGVERCGHRDATDPIATEISDDHFDSQEMW
jgi:hypothetical protein